MLRRMVKKDAESFLNNETIILRFNLAECSFKVISTYLPHRFRVQIVFGPINLRPQQMFLAQLSSCNNNCYI